MSDFINLNSRFREKLKKPFNNLDNLLKPKGLIITDSYNNFLFPIKRPLIDTNEIDFHYIIERYESIYLNSVEKNKILPWHFVIEYTKSGYFLYNARSLFLKFPLTSYNAVDILLDNNIKITKKQEEFFIEHDITEYFHLLIIGNSNKDVYTNSFYKLINENIIKFLITNFFISKNNIHSFNIGNKFSLNKAINY